MTVDASAFGRFAAFGYVADDVERRQFRGKPGTVRFVLRGTHDEAFFGIPATHRDVTVCANVIMRLEGDKVKELFGVFDEAGMLRQMGVIPS